MKAIDKCLKIIELTNDGDKLSPNQLGLTELAVNGRLNELGLKKLDELYNKVINNEDYTEWLNNITFMTIDHEGYVYFKRKDLEHYNTPWAYSEEGIMETLRLQKICILMENNNEEICFRNFHAHSMKLDIIFPKTLDQTIFKKYWLEYEHLYYSGRLNEVVEEFKNDPIAKQKYHEKIKEDNK